MWRSEIINHVWQCFGLLVLVTGILVVNRCKYSDEAVSGQSAYQLKQYAVAVDKFQEEYNSSKKSEDKAFFAYMSAQCYESMNDVDQTLKWYRKAVELEYGPEAFEGYAYALMSSEQYENAATIFDHLLTEYGADKTYSGEIANCKQAVQWLRRKLDYNIAVEPSPINTDYSEYAPVLMDQNTVLFTSDRVGSRGGEAYAWTGNSFSDFFTYDLRTQDVNSFEGPFNTSHNEGAGAFNADRSEFYFTRCFAEDDDHFCKIYFSYNDDDEGWSSPDLLPYQKDNVNYGHPIFFNDDQLIIYSANDPEGVGGYDLFAMTRKDGGWSEPFILDGKINTPGNEKFPTANKDTLYFSSDYMSGMGGLDIFMTYPDGKGSWHRPVNLQSPINSGADDFSLQLDNYRSGKGNIVESGFFSSSRKSGKGGDDIYHYTITKRVDPSGGERDTTVAAEKEEGDYLYYLAGTVYANVREDATNPNSPVIGEKILQNVPVTIHVESDTLSLLTDDKGRFLQEIILQKDYTIWARDEDYLNKSLEFSTKNEKNNPLEPVRTFNVKIGLEKIVRGMEITLENIYYDFNEAYIREDAMPTLNELVKLLRDNPSINIKLGSHTDCRASNEFNLELSNRRAKSAVDYLISKSISPTMLSSQGFGESKLLISCECSTCSEEEHQINRRTTFEIL